MKNIGFFTPVTNYPSSVFSFTEWYFNFGSKSAEIVHKAEEANYVKLTTTPWTRASYAATALKVSLVFTLLLPLTALLFATKVVFRLNHRFTVETNSAPHNLMKLLTSEHETAQRSIARLNLEIEKILRDRQERFDEIDKKNQELSHLAERLERATTNVETLIEERKSLESQHQSELTGTASTLTERSAKAERIEKSLREENQQLLDLQQQLLTELEIKNTTIRELKAKAKAARRDAATSRSPSPLSSAAAAAADSEVDLKLPDSPPPTVIDLLGSFEMIEKGTGFENDLHAYLDNYCPGFTFEQALAKIKEGQALLKSILQDPQKVLEASHKLSDLEQKEQIGSLLWCWMAEALANKKPFNEGTFTTESEPQKLHQFLRCYPKTYYRRQSHFKGRVPKNGFGYGIDCSGGPAKKTHLLFEILDNGDRLFIKPENFGVHSWLDILFHGVEFIESLARHAGLGSNQAEGMQKERVDPNWIKCLEQFICSENEKVVDKAKTYGLSFIRGYLFEYQRALQAFLNECPTKPELLDLFKMLVPELEQAEVLHEAEMKGIHYVTNYLTKKLEQVSDALDKLPSLSYPAQTGHEVLVGEVHEGEVPAEDLSSAAKAAAAAASSGDES